MKNRYTLVLRFSRVNIVNPTHRLLFPALFKGPPKNAHKNTFNLNATSALFAEKLDNFQRSTRLMPKGWSLNYNSCNSGVPLRSRYDDADTSTFYRTLVL